MSESFWIWVSSLQKWGDQEQLPLTDCFLQGGTRPWTPHIFVIPFDSHSSTFRRVRAPAFESQEHGNTKIQRSWVPSSNTAKKEKHANLISVTLREMITSSACIQKVCSIHKSQGNTGKSNCLFLGSVYEKKCTLRIHNDLPIIQFEILIPLAALSGNNRLTLQIYMKRSPGWQHLGVTGKGKWKTTLERPILT